MATYYCDGGGWNEQTSLWAVAREDGEIMVRVEAKFKQTNHEAEFRAVIYALQFANDGDTIYSDAQSVVRQVNGEYKVRAGHIRPLYNQAMLLIKAKPRIKLKWCPRKDNRAGWYLQRVRTQGTM